MSNITITITKSDVMTAIERQIENVAVKHEGEEAYQRIATLAKDGDQLSQHWNDAMNILREEFRPFVVTDASTDTVVNFQLSLPERASTTQSELKAHVEAYLTYAVLQRWFAATNKDEVEAYSAEASARRERIHSALWERKARKTTSNWINF